MDRYEMSIKMRNYTQDEIASAYGLLKWYRLCKKVGLKINFI